MIATRDSATGSTSGNDAKYSRHDRGLCFGDDRFIALEGDPGSVGAGRPFISTSTDGSSWSDYREIPDPSCPRVYAEH